MTHASLLSGPGRPLRYLALALIALAVGAAISVAGAPGNADASSTPDYGFQQNVKHVILSVNGIDELETGSDYNKVCWTLVPPGDGSNKRWCAVRSGSKWKLSPNRKGVAIDISGGKGKLIVNPQTAPLAAGAYRWHITLGGCSEPTAATGSTGSTPATATTGCEFAKPNIHGLAIRVKPLIASGCKARGASQVSHGPRNSKKIALTFDDGPATITPQFLAKLKALKIPATFFVLGQNVSGRGKLLKQMLADGHELANHSWNHANLGGGGSGASTQMRNTNDAIKRLSGFKPCLFRPPYGATGSDLVSRVRAQHMTSILWDVDPLDWSLPGIGTIVNTIRKQTHAGSIILEHDGGGPRSQTLAALPQYVHTLKARGYKFVTVNELLGYKTTYRLGG